ncbi:MAG: hypothetical protein GWO04_37715, partial [Actinobacteria bacterium]|nr:hypothetical protein [Actinomycetota bacterium]
MDTDACTPERGVGVMHVNGTADTLVPYNGNPFVGYPSVMDTVDHWLDVNDCTSGPVDTLDEGQTLCQTWSGCRDGAEVVLCT